MTAHRTKNEPNARRAWTRPQIRRFHAGSAEDGANPSADGNSLS